MSDDVGARFLILKLLETASTWKLKVLVDSTCMEHKIGDFVKRNEGTLERRFASFFFLECLVKEKKFGSLKDNVRRLKTLSNSVSYCELLQ